MIGCIITRSIIQAIREIILQFKKYNTENDEYSRLCDGKVKLDCNNLFSYKLLHGKLI